MMFVDAIPDGTQEAAEKLRQAAEFSYSVARSNADLTPQAVQAAIARVYVDLETKMEALQEATNRQAIARRQTDLRTAFGSPSADPSSAISARDAADRAAQLGPEDDRQAADLLARATLNYDETLAAAIGYRAWELTVGPSPGGFGFGSAGWSDVLDAYLEARPRAAAALGDLSASAVKPNAAGMSCFWIPTPPELASLAPWQIQTLAA